MTVTIPFTRAQLAPERVQLVGETYTPVGDTYTTVRAVEHCVSAEETFRAQVKQLADET